ncbi:MAG: hypothetical protein J6A15_07250 [Clostridia bacterium]|nr:hypothetical protein [Clostridia bacterium]
MGYFIFGVAIYAIILVVTCIFLKGATQLGNEYDEKMENEMLYKKLYGNKE